MRDLSLSATLLEWYDAHARVMPWRISPERARAGQHADPYAVWISEVMLQQTTVAAVRGYFVRFTSRWPDVHTLAAAPDDTVMAAWAGLGYYARARNLLKCARVVADDLGGRFPDTRAGLQALPGIGPYTAAAIAAIAFNRHETVVDGNVERVMARLHDLKTPLPGAKPALHALAQSLTPRARSGDYAQAVMDLGATICTPRAPRCGLCPWRPGCKAYAAGHAADLPYRSAKPTKPTRRGLIYIARREDGAWLLERRPPSGLLGGMLGWPGSAWGDTPVPSAPLKAQWIALEGEVRHTFTHFHLRLRVHIANACIDAHPLCGGFVPQDRFRANDLPTVMRKAFHLASPELLTPRARG